MRMYTIPLLILSLCSFVHKVNCGNGTVIECPDIEEGKNATFKCTVNVTEYSVCRIPPRTVNYFITTLSDVPETCSSPFGVCNSGGQSKCDCVNESSDIYTYTLTFILSNVKHNQGSFTCDVTCIPSTLPSPNNINKNCTQILFPTTTLPTIFTTNTANTFPSENTTAVLECENCNCNDTCTCPKKCSEKCPVWCIIVAVCVPCGVCGIIITTVIIVIKKKAKATGNSAQDTKEMQDKTKHHGTENRPKNAQGGSNRAEVSAQDTKEMQDKTKHLGTENSPEREKRRKKKKKKKPFQEVDGETVSRENKSTVNDHKAAQNDNSVSVNENSPITYNGELRSLPMPKTPHLTSVERNSTIFQSETPRKLPPLQPKAMIIP